ncbi:MAG TPA: hypothetical protein VF666_07185 [Pyrinomonadaceae bacterium]|jgi:hypothetical protein
MHRSFSSVRQAARGLAALVLFVVAFEGAASAQSTDATYPTPVTSNEITGRIAPRDIGDARLTRHFYTFNGTEGDLVVMVESVGLDGDVDVFTANGLRPLAKVTMYGGLSATRVSKSIYLRRDEALVLRVEARSAGDVEGTYRVRFEGAFAPLSGALANAPEPVTPTLPEPTSRRNTRRVTSSGARIAEPPADTATAATDAAPTETPATSDTATAEPPAPTRRPARRPTRNARTPRTRTPRTTQPTNTAPSTSDETAETRPMPDANTDEATNAPATRRTARTPRARTPRTRPSSRSATRTAPPDGAATPSADASTASLPSTAGAVVTATRLVVETKDGSRIERDMTNVRRVTVENNQLVIVRRDGRVERVPMANVLRMSIEP